MEFQRGKETTPPSSLISPNRPQPRGCTTPRVQDKNQNRRRGRDSGTFQGTVSKSSAFKIYLSFFLFGCAGSLLLHRLFSSCGGRGLRCTGFSLQWPLSLRGAGSAGPQHVGSSQMQDQTRVSCIARWILYH